MLDLTKEERQSRRIIDQLSDRLYDLYNYFVFDNNFSQQYGLRSISKRVKDNGDEYGYFNNPAAGLLYILLQRLEKRKLIDLGSGAGLLLAALKAYDNNLKLAGIEIEDELITIAGKLSVETEKKDLLNLVAEDIKDYEVVYFFEPFRDAEAAKKFVDNLARIMYKGQIIIMKPAGEIKDCLMLRKDLKMIDDESLATHGTYEIFVKE